ncbi:MAG: hypothetical protein A2788_00665 [Candidatus Abawacabacteria bacterium RIFCSPHIGHO2_01_FULL_46_8]|uniref:SLH domain-containing protein n=1 Tax=Candidatus Abawacabacteria bacterium RIFCSPHIGHO2_01_FULL_46_8 TaxID=1817815 RepID=A0A1F4XKA9_9BACT|nr:MAG: hypothetical protein A2788_00665 [Candidatus Abawacabacteria bacterium RIFCSPHIGHO2_01_FULL_46_8]
MDAKSNKSTLFYVGLMSLIITGSILPSNVVFAQDYDSRTAPTYTAPTDAEEMMRKEAMLREEMLRKEAMLRETIMPPTTGVTPPTDMGRPEMMKPPMPSREEMKMRLDLRLKDVQLRHRTEIEEKKGSREFKLEDKQRTLDRFKSEHKEKVESFLGELKARDKHNFEGSVDKLPEAVRESLAEKLNQPENKAELKEFFARAGQFNEEQNQEHLKFKLELLDKERSLDNEIEQLKEKKRGLARALEVLERNRERFVEKHHFVGRHGEEMKAKLDEILAKLKEAGASEEEIKKAIERFEKEMKQIVRENFQERLQRGEIPFADTPDDSDTVIDPDGKEKKIPGHDPAFFEHIKKLKDKNVIKGFDDGTFRSGAQVKVAELLKMAVGAAGDAVDYEGSDPGTSGRAEGLEKSPKWHRILYNRAKETGVLEEDDRNPDREATRAEAVRWILRSYGIPVQQGLDHGFSDVAAGDPDADAIAVAKKLGIVKGVDATRFLPDGKVSRAEMAKIISNAEEALGKIDPASGAILENGTSTAPVPVPVAAPVVAPAAPVPTAPASTIREISMESGNLFFKPNLLMLKAGEPVRITFSNAGGHTFTIDELGVNISLQGSSAIAEFTPTKTGTFEFYCAVGGHRAAGMLGKVTVE